MQIEISSKELEERNFHEVSVEETVYIEDMSNINYVCNTFFSKYAKQMHKKLKVNLRAIH